MTGVWSEPLPGVKAALTRKRPRRRTETDDYVLFARRILNGLGRRVASGDVENVAALAELSRDVDRVLADAVAGLRAAGYSWAEIAARLGVTRQAAQQRWGHR